MFIKQVRAHMVRVPDPLRPGKYAKEERLLDAGATSISAGDRTYQANERGYFDIPRDAALPLLSLHFPGGERFATAAELGEDPVAESVKPRKRSNAE